MTVVTAGTVPQRSGKGTPTAGPTTHFFREGPGGSYRRRRGCGPAYGRWNVISSCAGLAVTVTLA